MTVLIIGGAGNFGRKIAAGLKKHNVPVILLGRTEKTLKATGFPFLVGDVAELPIILKELPISVVIHTAGPFQGADYSVAEACIEAGVNYIDLADGREFVTNITRLDAKAKAKGIAVISGASSVPGLSSAVLAHYRPQFSRLDSMIYGIAPGQKAERGLATTKAILSYVGRKIKGGYGWQDLHAVKYPFGTRLMGNCDIPDLDLFDVPYLRFSAGLEVKALHVGLWAFSWLVRAGLPLNLPRFADFMLKIASLIDRFGSDIGGMHVFLKGLDQAGKPLEKRWFLVAKSGHGPQIPCVPAILLAMRELKPGAYPAVGLISLEDYLEELKAFDIEAIYA
jgi:hypothetical protein